jgi:HEPN domain-containing protein
MERIGGVHAEWYRRHIAHLAYALEEGDHGAACYHAYQAVSALLSGVVGLDPYAPGASSKPSPQC